MDGLGENGRKADVDFETSLTQEDRLELRVWLRLLSCTNLIEQSVRKTLRDDFEITLPRFDLLSQLDRAPEGLTMGELSRRLMVTNGNVTGLIDRLVTEGLVDRQPSPTDRRSHLVKLTATGRKAFQEITPKHEAVVQRNFGGMDRSQMRELHELLGTLKQGVSDESTN